MENLYLAISQRLSETFEELSYIDEDFGQLIATEDGYPVTFPAILIDAGVMNWETPMGYNQRGSGEIIIKLAVDCYEDTHCSAGTSDKMIERIKLQNNICAALHLFKPGANYSQLLRTQSKFYSLPGMIKVYEITFKVKAEEGLVLIK